MKLWKMQGAGNDFLILDNRQEMVADLSRLTERICHRHFGIGADGLMALSDSSLGAIRMTYFNADGTRDTMCGNGIRCLAKFARDNGIVKEKKFTIETEDGLKKIEMIREEKALSQVRIDMGGYTFDTGVLQIDTEQAEFISQPLKMKDGRIFFVSCVHLGVNHGVIFVEDDLDYVGMYGSELEHHPVFQADMNLNFVKRIDPSHLEVSTWERGAGRTLACGTGVSSSVVVAGRLFEMETVVEVKAPGGKLTITRLDNGTVLMEGPAAKVAEVTLEEEEMPERKGEQDD